VIRPLLADDQVLHFPHFELTCEIPAHENRVKALLLPLDSLLRQSNALAPGDLGEVGSEANPKFQYHHTA
jgi:hypothetical protein